MSMFNDITCDRESSKEECVANAKVVKVLVKKFGIGPWSFICPGSEKKWSSVEENSPQGILHHVADKMLLEFADSTCPIFPCYDSFGPQVNSEAKDMENCRFTCVPTRQRLRLFA